MLTFAQSEHSAGAAVDRPIVDANYACPAGNAPKYGESMQRMTPTSRPTRFSHPREYDSWRNMKRRCRDGSFSFDPRFEKFPEFMEHMGPVPTPGYTLDRINTHLTEYSPANCQWSSKAEQTRNRSNTRWATDDSGLRQSLAEWSRTTKLPIQTITSRIRRGWSEHDAVSTPVGQRRSRDLTETKAIMQEPAGALISAWKAGLSTDHGQRFFVARPKEAKILKNVAMTLRAGGIVDPVAAIRTMISNWSDFTAFTETNYGAFKSPRVPTVEYLCRFINAAGNYLLKISPVVQQPVSASATPTSRHPKQASAPNLTPREARVNELLKQTEEFREHVNLCSRMSTFNGDWDSLVSDALRAHFECTISSLQEDGYTWPLDMMTSKFIVEDRLKWLEERLGLLKHEFGQQVDQAFKNGTPPASIPPQKQHRCS